MNCPNCGTVGNSKFCTKCGTRMPDAPVNVASDAGATARLNQAELQAYMAQASQNASQPQAYAPPPASAPVQQWAPPVSASTAVAERPVVVAGATGGFPVTVTFEQQETSSKLYAIPVLGIAIKYFMLIPHMIMLGVMGFVSMVLFAVLWIPVLATGRYPEVGYNMIGGTLRWGARVGAFLYGLTDQYPPFSLSGDDGYPVQVTFEQQETSSKLYAIPVLGIAIKYFMLIPHLIMLMGLGFVAMVLFAVLWIPVLATGKYPQVGYNLIGGTIRHAVRTYSFLYGLTDQYPPFSLN